MVSDARLADVHVGLEGDAKQASFKEPLTRMFEAAGMCASGLPHVKWRWHEEGLLFSFFGITSESWSGKIWPRSRGGLNKLSKATLEDNFSNRGSGGLGFLKHRFNGSKVSIEPDPGVFSCRVKTRQLFATSLRRGCSTFLDRSPTNSLTRRSMPVRPSSASVLRRPSAGRTRTSASAATRSMNACSIQCRRALDAAKSPVMLSSPPTDL